MPRPILNSPRILRTGQPLTLAQTRTVAPSMFARTGSPTRSERFLPIPTVAHVEEMLTRGWGIYEVSQNRSRKEDEDMFSKHMLRMRKLEDFNTAPTKEGFGEVVIINANNGTSRFRVMAGFYRFICSNGMVVGNTLGGVDIKHTVTEKNLALLEASEKVMGEDFPRMFDQIDYLRTKRLGRDAQVELAQHAITARYGDTHQPITPADLLAAQREEDAGDEAWKVLSRIQENVIYGGFKVRSVLFGRQSTVRGVQRPDLSQKINSAIWERALELAE